MRSMPKNPPAATTENPPPPRRWWWWVVAVFALQIAIWTAWFIVAAHHPVQEIPVSGRSAR